MKWREDEMRIANWPHDEKGDSNTCPEGRKLFFEREKRSQSYLRYVGTGRVYRCEGCSECTRKRMRTKSQAEDFVRRIEINPTKMFFRERASRMLHTERGLHLRKKRAVDVETVFGDIKRNHRFDRFTLRGLDKVSLEFRLAAMGHNIRKVTGMLGGMEGAAA